MWRFLFIAFLIAHGLHPPRDLGDSAEAQGRGRPPVRSLALVAAGRPEGAGEGRRARRHCLAHRRGTGRPSDDADWWRSAAVAGLATSLGLMVVYFDRWFLFIEVVNAALIVGILWLSWSSPAMVGT